MTTLNPEEKMWIIVNEKEKRIAKGDKPVGHGYFMHRVDDSGAGRADEVFFRVCLADAWKLIGFRAGGKRTQYSDDSLEYAYEDQSDENYVFLRWDVQDPEFAPFVQDQSGELRSGADLERERKAGFRSLPPHVTTRAKTAVRKARGLGKVRQTQQGQQRQQSQQQQQGGGLFDWLW
jgi:hypothetical protein